MKKINSLQQLQTEKNRIIQHQEELAREIRSDWKEVKINTKPGRIIKDSFIEAIIDRKEKERNGKNILKNALAFGTIMLAKKFAAKAVQKLGRIFNKRR